jgi:hypothetical protein
MAKTKVFISCDYDHDETPKEFLVGQSKLEDSPFELADWSIKDGHQRRPETEGSDENKGSRRRRGYLRQEHGHRDRRQRGGYDRAGGRGLLFPAPGLQGRRLQKAEGSQIGRQVV